MYTIEREPLKTFLIQGLSLEAIGQRTGKHASTVGYWVKKHGLVATNREKFAPKGGISKEPLARLVEADHTLTEMAAELGVSIATVRYWLARHGFPRASAKRQDVGPRPRETVRRCSRHGRTKFVLEGRGYYRCATCRFEAVSDWRRRTKTKLVAEAGGRCRICGYDRYNGALQFHHVDPATKEFSLSVRGLTRSIERIRAELRKCVLLCANCHAEVEAGVVQPEDATILLSRSPVI